MCAWHTKPSYIAVSRFGALIPHPSPEPVVGVPVDAGKHSAGPTTVAIIIPPSTQDRIEVLECLAKRSKRGIAPRQLFDPIPKIFNLCFGDLDARAAPKSSIPPRMDMEPEELEPIAPTPVLVASLRQGQVPDMLQGPMSAPTGPEHVGYAPELGLEDRLQDDF